MSYTTAHDKLKHIEPIKPAFRRHAPQGQMLGEVAVRRRVSGPPG